MVVHRFALSIRQFLNHPARVAMLCMAVLFMSLLLNGIVWRLWGLHRDHERLAREIVQTRQELTSLDLQLQQAKDPVFIERQARDKLDLASEDDLVFVFPSE